jgi:lactoylglutathione lyase
MDVAHVAIWVSDLESSKAFYEDGLGLEYAKDFVGSDGVTNYFVSGETDTFIQLKYDDDEGGEVEPSGIAHIAISVDDTDEVFERVATRDDCTVVQEPQDFSTVRNAFVADPDGYVLELEQRFE